ncbi:hypothetical protein D3C73_1208820 [compost metagenome]
MQTAALAVGILETPVDVPQPNAFRSRRRLFLPDIVRKLRQLFRGKPLPVVGYRDPDASAQLFGFDEYAMSPLMLLNAMLNRVLDNRLDHQRHNPPRTDVLRQLDPVIDLLAERHDRQIMIRELKLGGYGYVPGVGLRHIAVILGQMLAHPHDGIRRCLGHRHDKEQTVI